MLGHTEGQSSSVRRARCGLTLSRSMTMTKHTSISYTVDVADSLRRSVSPLLVDGLADEVHPRHHGSPVRLSQAGAIPRQELVWVPVQGCCPESPPPCSCAAVTLTRWVRAPSLLV